MAHYSKVNTGINYRSYVAQLTQSGSNPPDPIVLQNDLGYTPTWNRFTDGEYALQATEFDNENNSKVVVFLNIGSNIQAPMEFGYMAHAIWSKEDNQILLRTSYYDGNTTIPGFLSADNLLSDEDGFFPASFELRIYN